MIEALTAFGPAAEPAVPAIIRVLRHAHAESYEVAYMIPALARIAPTTKSADAALAALIEAIDSQPWTRLEAVKALPAFGKRAASAIPRLRTLQKDRVVGDAATTALAAIEDGEASHERRQPE